MKRISRVVAFVLLTTRSANAFSLQTPFVGRLSPRRPHGCVSSSFPSSPMMSSARKNNASTSVPSLAKMGDISLSTALTSGDMNLSLDDSDNDNEHSSSFDKPPFPLILWRFTRPHTLIGSAIAIPALHIFAAPTLQAAFTRSTFISTLFATIPALFMNLYITGLNQITDVEIDKINKPDLPMAAGILSRKDAIISVLVSLVASLCMGGWTTSATQQRTAVAAAAMSTTQGLQIALWGSGILGTLYSLEPFRLKRFPALAAFCIVAVRGTIINAGFYAHAQAAAFGNPAATVLGCLTSDPKCYLSSAFFAIFGMVIALMKDVPDVRGDELSNVRTFSVRMGQGRVFHGARRLLTGLFLGVGANFLRLAAMATSSSAAAPPLLVIGRISTAVFCVMAGLSVGKESVRVNPENSDQVYSFYMHLWKLFYLSYLILPFAR